jgi:phenylalanyl-tRNA synthetase beta chain
VAVTVPAHRRNDVTREADVVEEIARLLVLEDLPATLPSRRGASGRLSIAQRARRRAEDALVGAGLSEALGWSFESPDTAAALELEPGWTLENPLSESLSVMRTTLLGSLLTAMRHNRARGIEDVRLFEVGAVYGREGDAAGEPRLTLGAGTRLSPDGRPAAVADHARPPLPDEKLRIAALLTGLMRPVSWREPSPPRADFFAAKAVLSTTLDALRVAWEVAPDMDPHTAQRPDPEHPLLHPGRGARVLIGGRDVGWLGELHPTVAGRWDLDVVAGFELDLDSITAASEPVPVHADLTSFPSVRQDLAVTVADDVPAADVLRVVPRGRRPAAGGRNRVRRLPGQPGGGGALLARAAPRVPRFRTAP